ncbi:hypothetical protein BDC45DRAFT_4465 [Circinella umbellata]|nr:hypothetical protein BDC45DRAFT_4465 [Circinella umbellata]
MHIRGFYRQLSYPHNNFMGSSLFITVRRKRMRKENWAVVSKPVQYEIFLSIIRSSLSHLEDIAVQRSPVPRQQPSIPQQQQQQQQQQHHQHQEDDRSSSNNSQVKTPPPLPPKPARMHNSNKPAVPPKPSRVPTLSPSPSPTTTAAILC